MNNKYFNHYISCKTLHRDVEYIIKGVYPEDTDGILMLLETNDLVIIHKLMYEYPYREFEEVLGTIVKIIENRILNLDILNIKTISCRAIQSGYITESKIMIEAIININPKDVNRLKVTNPKRYEIFKKCNMV